VRYHLRTAVESKHRRRTRGKRDQLLTLLNGWDPAGLVHSGGPRDVYDILIDDLLGLLERDASKEEIAAFLEARTSDQFGVRPEGSTQFATKTISWFRIEDEADA
jgi:hypothetical protein